MRLLRHVLQPALTLALAAAALVVCATTADAFNLRSPQIAFSNGTLQSYLTGKGQAINTLTDQLDAQVWSTSLSGNSTFTIMVEMTASANANGIGIYNTNVPVPVLFQVFPGAATVGWHALAHFDGGNLLVSLFDNFGAFQGQTFYGGVDPDFFGFYIQGPGGLFFSQDWRNGGSAQILTYAGTGRNAGTWWECFEDLPYNAATSRYVSAVLSLESVSPVAASGTSWGRLKSLYR
jgi:hypothetical protein